MENFFYIYFIAILQKYTSAVVAHNVRDITPWPTAVGAARSGPLAWPRRGEPMPRR
jgi:hypothetical protein